MNNQRRRVRIGLVQTPCNGDPAENLERAIAGIDVAAEHNAQIVCLPELFRTPYFCQSEDVRHFDQAEPIPGPTTEQLCATAAGRGVVIIAGIFEKRAAGVYHNSAVVVDADGRIVGVYRKMHIPHDPNYFEKFYFTPGDLPWSSFPTRFARVGVLICWDQWFPEAARLAALTGAEIIFYPTAIGWLEGEQGQSAEQQAAAWETVQRAHAIANGIYVAAVNRVGREGSLTFWGRSFVADPMGVVVARADADQQCLLAECDLTRLEQVRRSWPFFRDRRIDTYAGLMQRWLESPGR
jgi:N-carbamoylputrescine amidase